MPAGPSGGTASGASGQPLLPWLTGSSGAEASSACLQLATRPADIAPRSDGRKGRPACSSKNMRCPCSKIFVLVPVHVHRPDVWYMCMAYSQETRIYWSASDKVLELTPLHRPHAQPQHQVRAPL